MITQKYIPFDELSRTGVQIETDSVSNIIEKLDPEFADELRTSLVEYTEHVKRMYRNLIVNFYNSNPTSGL